MKLLYIDDDHNMRVLMRELLGRAGWDVTTAPDGTAGVQAFEQGKFDIVVTDFQMPGYNGLEVIKRIAGKCPIYLISGIARSVGKEAKELGAEKVYSKTDVVGLIEDLKSKKFANDSW